MTRRPRVLRTPGSSALARAAVSVLLRRAAGLGRGHGLAAVGFRRSFLTGLLRFGLISH